MAHPSKDGPIRLMNGGKATETEGECTTQQIETTTNMNNFNETRTAGK